MADPRKFWTTGLENEFQAFMAFDPNVRAWRNAFQQKFGEPPQIDGGDFDYRQAYMAGNRPQMVEGDTVPHWSSVGKSADHPTAWKQDFMSQFGVDPDAVGRSGVATPEQAKAMQDQVKRDAIVRILLGGGTR